MKKTYINPEMNVSVFDRESVVTEASSVVEKISAAEYAAQNPNAVFGDAVNQAEVVLTF